MIEIKYEYEYDEYNINRDGRQIELRDICR